MWTLYISTCDKLKQIQFLSKLTKQLLFVGSLVRSFLEIYKKFIDFWNEVLYGAWRMDTLAGKNVRNVKNYVTFLYIVYV